MPVVDDDDRGHRYGNFPNYYSFHPPQNRLNVLKESGVLDYVTRRFFSKSLGVANSRDEPCEVAHKKPRIEAATPTGKKETSSATVETFRTVFYCDLGCNEGDLTIAMADELAELLNGESLKSTAIDNLRAHKSMERILVRCLGLDLDQMLIARANQKFLPCLASRTSNDATEREGESPSSARASDVASMFRACDLCVGSEHNAACASFMAESRSASGIRTEDDRRGTQANLHAGEPTEKAPKHFFDITTIFSTTMWIHVHAGDAGLAQFLKRACSWTKTFILIEPQPSVCYRKANARLRKMGRPQLEDVTSSRLKMRPDIEKEIEKLIAQNGFHRVSLEEMKQTGDASSDSKNGDKVGHETKAEDAPNLSSSGPKDPVTSWNRALHLYERLNN